MRLPLLILAVAAVISACTTLPGRPGAAATAVATPSAVLTPAPQTLPNPSVARRDVIDSLSPESPARHTASPPSTAATPGAIAEAPVSSAEVSGQAMRVFGNSLAVQPPTPGAADGAAEEPSWDLDVRSYETQDRVAHYVGMFTGRGKSRITDRLARGTRYEPMIRAKFRAGGLPEDMYYLALIESGFDPNAYSRAAAVGMWQFMTSTGRDMGMRIDWWVDERRDPVRSTAAAVRFISGLRNQFGSLYLAAAAYNGGPGRVARGLARYSDDLENTQQAEDAFFVLAEKEYLRNETRDYVPQLIAAALVAKEPVRYGMVLTPLPPFAYDSVRVPGGTPLAAVAKASATSVAVIRDLNPHILRGMTPPGSPMLVRVPVGSATGFDAALSALPKADRIGTHVVSSRKGQTVESVAEANGIGAASVETFNAHLRRLKPSGRLVPGQELVLPTPAVASASTHVPDPSIERYGGASSRRLRTHTVRHGETVRIIARRYHTTPERLMRLNFLRKPMIFAGQDLIVSGTPRTTARREGASAGTSRRRHAGSRSATRRHSSPARHGRQATTGPRPKRGAGTHSGAGSKASAR